jgi:hypothetical protein
MTDLSHRDSPDDEVPWLGTRLGASLGMLLGTRFGASLGMLLPQSRTPSSRMIQSNLPSESPATAALLALLPFLLPFLLSFLLLF